MKDQYPDPREAIPSFLRQRKMALRNLKYPNAWTNAELILVEKLQRQFNLIRDWGYWRYCREVDLNRDSLVLVLPSCEKKHKRIRERMIELLAHYCEVSSQPKALIDG